MQSGCKTEERDRRTDHQTPVHMPDVQFANWCLTRFGLNRGVYNTIDAWLFDQGVTDIVFRRELMILFLADSCGYDVPGEIEAKKPVKLKFGKNNLTVRLASFLRQAVPASLQPIRNHFPTA